MSKISIFCTVEGFSRFIEVQVQSFGWSNDPFLKNSRFNGIEEIDISNMIAGFKQEGFTKLPVITKQTNYIVNQSFNYERENSTLELRFMSHSFCIPLFDGAEEIDSQDFDEYDPHILAGEILDELILLRNLYDQFPLV